MTFDYLFTHGDVYNPGAELCFGSNAREARAYEAKIYKFLILLTYVV
jgi:hypothetical protein